jgi:hypothetical protein
VCLPSLCRRIQLLTSPNHCCCCCCCCCQAAAKRRKGAHLDPAAQAAWEDAALARAWGQLVRRDVPRAAKLAAARRAGAAGGGVQ